MITLKFLFEAMIGIEVIRFHQKLKFKNEIRKKLKQKIKCK